MIFVSILMSFRNPGRFFQECLESILSQQMTAWELIAIDDGSTDGSGDVIRALAREDARVKSFVNEGSGILPALSQALSLAQGNLITRMDADDIMPPGRLQGMSQALSSAPKNTVVTGLVAYFSEAPVSEGYQKYEQWINEVNLSGQQWAQVYRECVVASPNWMVRRDELVKIGGFDGLTYPEDYDLVLRWYRHRFQIQTIPEVTLHWREHPDRTSRNSAHYSQKAFFELKIKAMAQHDLRSPNVVLWGKNPKATHTAAILTEQGVPFHWHDLDQYIHIEGLANPQLIVAVYPEATVRKQIVQYLAGLGLQMGQDWWYV